MEIKTKLAANLEVSRIVLGMWRLLDWNKTDQELLSFIQESIETGVSTFDHADIYGNHECEAAFGKVMKNESALRDQMQLVTKCGIKLNTSKFPERKVKYYDYSASYIVSQVEESLKNLQTDYIDVLLLHRPSPFFNPEEVAKAFDQLKSSGKVLHFGVSNFLPLQLESLQAYVEEPLVTNQIEISAYSLEHFENQNLDYLISKKIRPMAWSPLAGGELLTPKTEKGARLLQAVKIVAQELGVSQTEQILYQWLLMHPSGIIPILGTGKIERIKTAVDSFQIKMSLEQWFQIYIASTGKELP
ncbi:aldo/keto reductase [uncultured Nonlabens sp.]|uniref:aldo/keto reductase n=1 Tax=uncultured Nonlabens sp. TaxID=859306 RepID=UPI0030DB2E57|tara:strand:+ start:1276 stop:2181 length:906 start_codon:yes stop_codon:yes gene_type:complete